MAWGPSAHIWDYHPGNVPISQAMHIDRRALTVVGNRTSPGDGNTRIRRRMISHPPADLTPDPEAFIHSAQGLIELLWTIERHTTVQAEQEGEEEWCNQP